MLSRNTKKALLLVLVAMVAVLLVGCEDPNSGSNGVRDTAKKYSGYVTTGQVKYAIKAIEDSGFGVSASAIGAELKAKYGECSISVDLYKAVGDRCEKMGLSRNCTTK